MVIPSDYMIARMIDEDMLEPLNFDNIPNFSVHRPDAARTRSMTRRTCTPCPTCGALMGVIYNTTMLDDVTSTAGSVLWDEKLTPARS